jgi:MYXO-CTERM domain-containing protein
MSADNLYYCGVDFELTCYGLHPLMEPILAEYVPVPVGLTADEFYSDLAAHAAEIDLLAWDAVAFAAALDERIFKPGLRATELLAQNPYLTRMYTTISPSEMNADPVFRSNATLPDVDNNRQATQRSLCDDSTLITLPDGREIYFPADAPLEWPIFQDEMPWDEDIDQENMADDAPLINLVDNTEKIDALLEDFNKQRGYGDIPTGCNCTVQQSGAAGSIAFGFMALGLFGMVRRRRH